MQLIEDLQRNVEKQLQKGELYEIRNMEWP